MRLELTRVGLLAELANHNTTRGALAGKRSEHKLGAKIYMASLDKSRDTPSRRKEEVVRWFEPSTHIRDYFSW